MNKIYLAVFFSLVLNLFFTAQIVDYAAVQISASVQTSPPTITLSWITNTTATQYTIYRKPKAGVTWGPPIATLSGTATSYADNSVSTGVSYEYRINRNASPTYTFPINGYINAGIEIAAIENRGNMILVVDSTFITSLAPELKRLQEDLEGDGWNVKRIDVLRTGSVTNVKAKITTVYNEDPSNTNALFIFGHVPVPYSGNINPDGHTDHQGAWPTDSYYADIDGYWSDLSISSTPTNPIRIVNVPGDGKFDQSILNSQIELQTGRVDLYGMPSFTLTELQLMKNYLDKDHDYRKKVFTVLKRGIVDSNFGYMNGEAFAASGYNNLSALVHYSNVTNGDYLTAMTGTNNSYLWSYGCGGGTYSSASGIGTTANFANSNLQGIFTMLFGSYFGDWDVNNSFLKAPLAQGKMLTCSWSGRPHHQYHHMGLGENIGYSMKTTINYQSSLYYPNYYNITGAWIHNGLMGDPSLRNDVVAPVTNVVATTSANNSYITWSASTETAVLGYNIYMKNDTNKTYVKLNAALLTGTTFSHDCVIYPGIYKYMVRAVKLENTSSGTYYNMSEGVADTANNTSNMAVKADFGFTIVSNTVTFNNTSQNASVHSWTINNGVTSNSLNPVFTYSVNGDYTVTLISTNNCDADTITKIVNITDVGIKEINQAKISFDIYPNPSSSHITLNCTGVKNNYKISIFNTEGKEVYKRTHEQSDILINVSDFNSGIYLVKLSDKEGNTANKKIIVE